MQVCNKMKAKNNLYDSDAKTKKTQRKNFIVAGGKVPGESDIWLSLEKWHWFAQK